MPHFLNETAIAAASQHNYTRVIKKRKTERCIHTVMVGLHRVYLVHIVADGVNGTSRRRRRWNRYAHRKMVLRGLKAHFMSRAGSESTRTLASLLHSDPPSLFLGFFGPSDGGETTRLSTFVAMYVCVQVIGYRRPHTTPLMKGYHSNGVTVKRPIGTTPRNFHKS